MRFKHENKFIRLKYCLGFSLLRKRSHQLTLVTEHFPQTLSVLVNVEYFR